MSDKDNPSATGTGALILEFPTASARSRTDFARAMREKCAEMQWSLEATDYVIGRLEQIDAPNRHMRVPREDWMHLSASAIWNLAAAFLEAWDYPD